MVVRQCLLEVVQYVGIHLHQPSHQPAAQGRFHAWVPPEADVFDIAPRSLAKHVSSSRLQPLVNQTLELNGLPPTYNYLTTLLSCSHLEEMARLQDTPAAFVYQSNLSSTGQGVAACPFEGLSIQEITATIYDGLQSEPGARRAIEKLVEDLGAEEVFNALQETHSVQAGGGRLISSGERPRTAVGVFLRICKGKQAARQQALALRARLSSRADVIPELRQYQRRVVEDLCGVYPRNGLVVAPTGTGKTRMFVECVRRLMEQDPKRKAIVLVPNVALCSQHHAQFQAAGFEERGWRVGSFHGGRPLSAMDWAVESRQHSVMVMTVMTWVNIVNAHHMACFVDVDIMVLDEAHHIRKRDPYIEVLQHYRLARRMGLAVPWVLACTASPASANTEERTASDLERILDMLDAGICCHVPEDDEEVRGVAPPPAERDVYIARRPQDAEYAELLWRLACGEAGQLEAAVEKLWEGVEATKAALVQGNAALEPERAALLEQQELAEGPSRLLLPQGDAPALNAAAVQSMRLWLEPAVLCCLVQRDWPLLAALQFLRVMLKATELCDELGREAALRYLAAELEVVALRFPAAVVQPAQPDSLRTPPRAALQTTLPAAPVDADGSAVTAGVAAGPAPGAAPGPEVSAAFSPAVAMAAPAATSAATRAVPPANAGTAPDAPVVAPTANTASTTPIATSVTPTAAAVTPSANGVTPTAAPVTPAAAAVASTATATPSSTASAVPPGPASETSSSASKLSPGAGSDPGPARTTRMSMAEYLAMDEDVPTSTVPPSPPPAPLVTHSLSTLIPVHPTVLPQAATSPPSTSPPPLPNLQNPGTASTRIAHLDWTPLDGMIARLFTGRGSLADVVPVAEAFPSGDLAASSGSGFPKLQELRKYLMEHQGKQDLHGVVFVNSRQAAYHIAEWLDCCPQLSFIEEVLVFTGHGSSSKEDGPRLPGSLPQLFVRGMTATQQENVLARFRAPGRRLLISTSAAEEGVDVPSCSFVVRFSAAATGIRRVQSRGRSRQLNSEYVCLVHRGGLEEDLHRQGQLQEANMRSVLGVLSRSQRLQPVQAQAVRSLPRHGSRHLPRSGLHIGRVKLAVGRL